MLKLLVVSLSLIFSASSFASGKKFALIGEVRIPATPSSEFWARVNELFYPPEIMQQLDLRLVICGANPENDNECKGIKYEILVSAYDDAELLALQRYITKIENAEMWGLKFKFSEVRAIFGSINLTVGLNEEAVPPAEKPIFEQTYVKKFEDYRSYYHYFEKVLTPTVNGSVSSLLNFLREDISEENITKLRDALPLSNIISLDASDSLETTEGVIIETSYGYSAWKNCGIETGRRCID